MNLNPPGGVNLAIAIFAFIGATLSVVGFITNHLPHQQYADLCHILQGIESALADDQRWPSDHLLQRYRSVSANVEKFHYLVTPSFISAFNLRTAWRLRNIRKCAARLKVELIALAQIQKSKKLQESLSSTTSTSKVDSCECLPV